MEYITVYAIYLYTLLLINVFSIINFCIVIISIVYGVWKGVRAEGLMK